MISLDIVIPFYGDPALLLRAVESVRAVDDADWRLTIVEDVHPLGRQAEDSVLALADERIRYLRNDSNLGVAANTHRCFELAEREFVLVTDYDDLLLPNYATAVGDLFDRYPEAVVVQPAVEIIDEAGEPYLPLPDRVKGWLAPDGEACLAGEPAVASLLRGNWLYCPALCYRRCAVSTVKPRPDADAVHDLARVVDVLCEGGSLAVGTTTAFRYRRHHTSHSSGGARTGVRFEQERRYFEAVASEMAARGWHRAARAARQRQLSRINALTQLPGALASRRGVAVRTLMRHAMK